MTEVAPDVFVGDENDYETRVKGKADWFAVQACKEPYHRAALGYKGRGAPKEHPEYLVAHREGRLILNLVDAADPSYIPKQIIDTAIMEIGREKASGKHVLVHCNKGESRSATIALLFLVKQGIIKADSFAEAEGQFRRCYPNYNPSSGMRGFAVCHFTEYSAL